MDITEREITPRIAREMLNKNNRNRPLNDRHVKLLAGDMSAGRWKFNGDSIRLNGDTLIDGQHRLHACICSGTTFKTLIIDGLDPDVFDTIDTGRRRGAADALALRGEKNTRALASSLVFVDEYMTGRISSRGQYTNTKVEALLLEYPDIRNSVRFCIKLPLKKLAPQSVFIGCHYLFSKSNPQLADSFCESFLKGINLKENDPIYLLRERMMQNTISKAKLKRAYIAAIFIKAWNHSASGTTIKYLRWRDKGDSPEMFPIIK